MPPPRNHPPLKRCSAEHPMCGMRIANTSLPTLTRSSCRKSFIDNGWVRVAVDATDTPLGFSVPIPTDDCVHELDGLFVEPNEMSGGIGRALVEDAAARAAAQGATSLEVTAGPAQGFDEKV